MGQNKYYPPPIRTNFELICPNDGLTHFEDEHPNSFYVRCHLCDWLLLNPTYETVISDEEMLIEIFNRWENNRQVAPERWIDTPDKTLRYKYSEIDIYAKLEELEHRDLIEYGVSLRTAWLTKQGEAMIDEGIKNAI